MSEEACVRWESALNALESLYKDIEKRSLSVAGFSLLPFAIVMWESIKFGFCLDLDMLLLVPMNAVIFLRNLFPGKWRYRSFSGRYWRYAITWLWRGEAPTFPIGIIRPLVTFVVGTHFSSRIDCLKRYVFLDDTLSDEDRLRIGPKIARMQEIWKRPTATQVVFNYIFPASGPLIGLYKFIFPGNLAPWVSTVGVIMISYSLAFVVSAMMVKRALMLGASGRAVYFPGAIAGTQAYGKERDILRSLGIQRNELPVDVLVGFVSVAVGYLLITPMASLEAKMGIPIPKSRLLLQMLIQGLIVIFLNGLVLFRRKATGRQ